VFYFNTGIPGNHNVWSRTFEELSRGQTPGGNLTDVLGMNVYEWMLQNELTAALPLTWESFSAAVKDQSVQLDWMVSNERQVQEYQVERSGDGRTWEVLSTVPAQQGNGSLKKYVYLDLRAFSSLRHYRIKQIDLDGAFTYSPVRTVDLSSVGKSIRIFPNPIGEKFFIASPDYNNKAVTVEVFSSSGILIGKEIKQLTNNQVEVSMTGRYALAKGILLIRVSDETGKLIIQQSVLKN
jgi:hypothetical protein